MLEDPLGNAGNALGLTMNGSLGVLQAGVGAFTGGAVDVDAIAPLLTGEQPSSGGSDSSSSSSSSSSGLAPNSESNQRPGGSTAPGAPLDPASVIAELADWATFGGTGAEA